MQQKHILNKLIKQYRKRFEVCGTKCAFKRGNYNKQYRDSISTICGFVKETLKKPVVWENGNYSVIFTLLENNLKKMEEISYSAITEKDIKKLDEIHSDIMNRQNTLINFLYQNYSNPISEEDFKTQAVTGEVKFNTNDVSEEEEK